MVISNMTSADISQKSADVILTKTIELSQLKISQHYFKKEWTFALVKFEVTTLQIY
jgi:hypothetical protein